jgi:hypothetical protein
MHPSSRHQIKREYDSISPKWPLSDYFPVIARKPLHGHQTLLLYPAMPLPAASIMGQSGIATLPPPRDWTFHRNVVNANLILIAGLSAKRSGGTAMESRRSEGLDWRRLLDLFAFAAAIGLIVGVSALTVGQRAGHSQLSDEPVFAQDGTRSH